MKNKIFNLIGLQCTHVTLGKGNGMFNPMPKLYVVKMM